AGAPDLRRRGGPDGAGGVGRRAGQVRRHGRHVAEPHLLRRRRQDLPGAGQRMSSALLFWLLVEALGLLALPVAATWLGRLPGRGLVLARPLALLLVAYPAWLLASLHLLPYSAGTILLGV